MFCLSRSARPERVRLAARRVPGRRYDLQVHRVSQFRRPRLDGIGQHPSEPEPGRHLRNIDGEPHALLRLVFRREPAAARRRADTAHDFEAAGDLSLGAGRGIAAVQRSPNVVGTSTVNQ